MFDVIIACMDLPFDTTHTDMELAAVRAREEEDLARILSEKYGMPYADLSLQAINTDALRLIPEATARAAEAAAFAKTAKELSLALHNPNNPALSKLSADLAGRGFTLRTFLVSKKSLDRALERYRELSFSTESKPGVFTISPDVLSKAAGAISTLPALAHEIEAAAAEKSLDRISHVLEVLLSGAFALRASDIHFEPTRENTRLRYRLDGVLDDITAIDKNSYEKVVNRIKVLSRLKLNVDRSPQDGRFTIREGKADIEVRVSVLPSEFGETIVMRLLDPRTIHGKLEDLGMRPDFLELVKEHLKKPTGAIFTTGPTGSGKTTTLYAFVRYLNSPEEKIITIEDPIEYRIEGISQTQVDPSAGYAFADGLRSIVRQDPDIILVGEIRDTETAEIALNAALTGHLVLSTLHTNDAAGTIPRLIDLKVQPQIIAPAIRMAMAQRLVRRLCENCRVKRTAGSDEIQKIKSELEPVAAKFNLKNLENPEIYEPKGCEKCSGKGYKGRTGVYEAFQITPEMEKLIMSNPPLSAVSELAVQQGMITMKQDAYLKLLDGVTDFEEIERILG